MIFKVDANILKELETYNFNAEHAKKCIEANKHNHITTTYYLLLQKYIKSGGYSIADISNLSFKPNSSNTTSSTTPTNTTTSTRERESIPGKKKDITIKDPSENITTIINSKTNPTSPNIQNEINLSKFIPMKGTVNVNVNVNVNLNNLNTSLTKELDRSILLSPKNETQIKFEQRTVQNTEPDDLIQLDEKRPRQLSPVVKTEKPNRPSHTREQINTESSVDNPLRIQT